MKRKSLFWKISILLSSILFVLSICYIFITAYFAESFYLEASQQAHGNVANNILDRIKINPTGTINMDQLEMYYESAKVLNPSLEMYHLDGNGHILSYYNQKDSIVKSSIEMKPLLDFINCKGTEFILGENPRRQNCFKAFSVAPIHDNLGKVQGYIYVIIASKDFESMTQFLMSSNMLKIGALIFLCTLLIALAFSLLLIKSFTTKLHGIAETVKSYSKGNKDARVSTGNNIDEFNTLSVAFNEMADTINHNVKELQSVDELRRELIANVSHDLRTPISIIKGYVETLIIKQDNIKPEQREQYLDRIMQGSNNLSNLVEQLFEYSKLESAKYNLNKKEVNIEDLLIDLHNKYDILAKKKSIEFSCQVGDNCSTIDVDESLFTRAMQNLIDNALKFTPEDGKIGLSVNCQDDITTISVTDNGSGIAKNEVKTIFNRFQKAKRHNDANQGAGLGLAIVKKIIEIHNFKIDVQSIENQGTTFTITI